LKVSTMSNWRSIPALGSDQIRCLTPSLRMSRLKKLRPRDLGSRYQLHNLAFRVISERHYRYSVCVSSSVSFTLDVYSHVVPGIQRAAMRRLDEILEPKLSLVENVGKRAREG